MTENIASVAEYSIDKAVEEALTISKNIYMNKYINNFLNADYDSHLAFYEAYQELMQDSLFDSSLGNSSVEITMYADNDTIVNGGKFKKLGRVKQTEWYQKLQDSGNNFVFCAYMDETHDTSPTDLRKVSIIRKLNRYMLDPHEKVLKIDLDYNAVNTGLLRANYESEVYICSGDKIIFSNTGRNNIKESFERFDKGTMHKCYVQETADEDLCAVSGNTDLKNFVEQCHTDDPAGVDQYFSPVGIYAVSKPFVYSTSASVGRYLFAGSYRKIKSGGNNIRNR